MVAVVLWSSPLAATRRPGTAGSIASSAFGGAEAPGDYGEDSQVLYGTQLFAASPLSSTTKVADRLQSGDTSMRSVAGAAAAPMKHSLSESHDIRLKLIYDPVLRYA